MTKVSIKKATYLESYKIELQFSDGQSRIVDFGPFLQSSRHPEIKIERARYFNQLSEKPEYKFIKDEFKEGLQCKYGNTDKNLVKIYSEGLGVKIDIHPDLANDASQSGNFVESLIRSTGETFSKSYYKFKGILSNDFDLDDVISAFKMAKNS